MQIPHKCSEIINFWFSDDFTHGMPTKSRNKLWFGASLKTDRLIATRFESDLYAASTGKYNNWCAFPEGRLAIIILLDQFPRNIYRGATKAFAYDEQARRLCLKGLELGHDQQLMPVYRSFYYMPLEHSESLNDQQRSVELFSQLHDQADPAIRKPLKKTLRYALQHRDIIKEFTRFPHRNAALGRKSTTQELEYLEQTGVNFGQGNNAKSKK